MSHKQLSFEERLAIAKYLEGGLSKTEIARLLDRDYTTIMREIKRNSMLNKKYNPVKAENTCRKRLLSRKNANKIDKNIVDIIVEKLLLSWSPEQIAFYLKMRLKKNKCVSTKTIYRWIKRGIVNYHGKYMTSFLRKKGKRYKHRKNKNQHMRDGKNISLRPLSAKNRSCFGHWEVDTVVSKKGKNGCLVTLVDRKSRFLKASVLREKTARSVYLSICEMLKFDRCLSITADNGKEFAEFEKIEEELSTEFYFADTYCSWQRGSNENTNGLLREFFPKGTNFSKVTQDEVDKAVYLINNRPCKTLNWYSRQEKYIS